MIAQFGSMRFEISADNAMLFADLKLSAGCETEDQSSNGQKFASYKEGKAAAITMTILLNAALGNDVRGTTEWLQHSAQRGVKEYMTLGGRKLYPFQLIMTKADADKIMIAPDGRWVSAEVSVSFTQAEAEYIIAPAPAPAPAGGGDDGYDPNASRPWQPDDRPGGLQGLLLSAASSAVSAASGIVSGIAQALSWTAQGRTSTGQSSVTRPSIQGTGLLSGSLNVPVAGTIVNVR